MARQAVSLFWFRRDLRVEDNAALWAALRSGFPVVPVFIFDPHILDVLNDRCDARVTFIHREITRLRAELNQTGGDLFVRYMTPIDAFEELTTLFEVKQVWANRDYEPYARERDQHIFSFFESKGIPFSGKKDQVIFEKSEIMKDDGKPYTVFTPYSRKWKQRLTDFYLKPYPTSNNLSHLLRWKGEATPSLADMNFRESEIEFPERIAQEEIIRHYEETRDIPSVRGTTRLSLHLRFGTVSIRALASIAQRTSEKWLNELIWREFYQMILYHFPSSVDHAFKPAYDRIPWRNDSDGFEKWCLGKTGYPMVDAGMRELNATGFMHNRVRMVTASFLTKHLLIDWRLGERYFAEKLLDFELSSNVGGWQWSAGSGCDAAPYFRVFNPTSQQEKFDKEFRYIRKWIPEFGTPAYPGPIVPHAEARERCLSVYKAALREG